MKKIVVFVLLGLAFAGYAQRGNGERHQYRGEFTPEQQAVLKTKKMALHLDLSQDQQDKLIEVNKKWSEKRVSQREAFKAQFEGEERPDADARYAHQLQMLDDQLAYQNDVKKILSKEQYASWKEKYQGRTNRGHSYREGHGNRRSGKRGS